MELRTQQDTIFILYIHIYWIENLYLYIHIYIII
jgi:hypothetical protein